MECKSWTYLGPGTIEKHKQSGALVQVEHADSPSGRHPFNQLSNVDGYHVNATTIPELGAKNGDYIAFDASNGDIFLWPSCLASGTPNWPNIIATAVGAVVGGFAGNRLCRKRRVLCTVGGAAAGAGTGLGTMLLIDRMRG